MTTANDHDTSDLALEGGVYTKDGHARANPATPAVEQSDSSSEQHAIFRHVMLHLDERTGKYLRLRLSVTEERTRAMIAELNARLTK